MSTPTSPPRQDPPADPTPVALRLPAHQVSPRARGYWRLTAALATSLPVIGLAVAWVLWGERPWWFTLLLVASVVVLLVEVVVMPPLRYRIHRWEVTGDAVHTRSGWLSIDERVAPLSRVQTVDSSQGPIQRMFRLRSLTVTTASAAGPISIECLDEQLARELVADLTAITSATRDDAT
ncbi:MULTISPECIES: PH domain-containing protein [unclassified Nocardioides]|uniref:PH domain-containing protein n=1 Tax=unclassified Nocardioides TaxID=2615069 RepID=UPI002405BFB5|nr:MULTISPECIES: PH domain-containing protein [unclassified Nocardioides]